MIPWIECDMCDRYECRVHPGLHTSDCDCPQVDVWMKHDAYPYTEVSQETIDIVQDDKDWDGYEQ